MPFGAKCCLPGMFCIYYFIQTGQEKTGRIMPFALLHALLLQQCYYGNGVFKNHHFWSLTDLAMAVDVYKKVHLSETNVIIARQSKTYLHRIHVETNLFIYIFMHMYRQMSLKNIISLCFIQTQFVDKS